MLLDVAMHRIDREFGCDLINLPFMSAAGLALSSPRVANEGGLNGLRVAEVFVDICVGGMAMEQTTEMLKVATEQMKAARKELESTANQVKAIRDIVFPELISYAREIQSMRMTAVSEMTHILNEMRQVHKFFIDASYEREMKQLERFVGLCKEIQKLKADGVFDAVCDSAIRLAVREVRHEGQGTAPST